MLSALVAPLLAPAAAPCAAPSLPWRQVAQAPHDPEAFTQGLVLDKGRLLESTGMYGRSELRRLDPATGTVLARTPLDPRLFGEGLALHAGLLYQLTWLEGKVLVYDAASLARRGELVLPGEGWGLASDGTRLIRSDGSSRLYFHDPKTFQVTGQVEVAEAGAPVKQLNELEYVSGLILANIWHSDRIAVISPATGNVLAWIDLAALRPASCPPGGEKVLNGIAYDPATGRLLVTGKLWPSLFTIEVDWQGLISGPGRNPVPKDAP